MRLIIDAWLERRAPYLQVIDSETRQTVARFEAAEVRELLAEGVVTAEELSELPSSHSLIQELLLAACCCRIRRGDCCEGRVCRPPLGTRRLAEVENDTR